MVDFAMQNTFEAITGGIISRLFNSNFLSS